MRLEETSVNGSGQAVREALARNRAWEEHGPSQWGYGVAIDLLALERRVSALERLSGAGKSEGEDNDSPGKGWRWVNAGVRVQEGDEFLSTDGKTWHPSTWRGEAPPRTYRRRRIKSHANHDAAPAARAEDVLKEPTGRSGPEGTVRTGDTQEPVDDSDWLRHAVASGAIQVAKLEAEIERLRLTDAEREAISEACDEGRWYPKDYHHIHTLRGLLDRLC
jgi:hypothetical protein